MFQPAAGSEKPSWFDRTNNQQVRISAAALKAYRALDASLTAEDLFFYVYGILHARDYREAFGADLKKSLLVSRR